MNNPHPLRLRRRLESRLWGGTHLATWLHIDDAPAQLAESWEVFVDNEIINGAYAGLTLRQLVQSYGADIVGTRSLQRYGHDFPLLAKFIDAGQALSVQVHPDDAYAHSHEADTGFHGKTEAWHIIATDGDCNVIHGFRHALSQAEYAAAIADGTLADHLHTEPVQAGDTVYVPAGTVHAINAGIVLYEIQQTSDLTYRVYDYQRRDQHGNLRELHIPQALAVSQRTVSPTMITTPHTVAPGYRELVRSEYFVLDHMTSTSAHNITAPAHTPQILTVLEGCMHVSGVGYHETLQRGQSVVIPAALTTYTVTPQPTCQWLRSWVPA